MVELNHRDRTIRVKIVYYGPPLCGKTTNLQRLHEAADAPRRGEMISVNSAQDRTILFDLLPLKTTGFRGFDLRLQLLAVPGQVVYAATRRLVLKGVDAVVFVANSAAERWDENIQSYREMTANLLSHHLDPATMPLVFQYNKRDLPQLSTIEALERTLNARHADSVPAVAVRGEGVVETFTAILARTVQDLANRYSILDVRNGTPAREWAEEAVQQLFGVRSLPVASPPPAAAAPCDGPLSSAARESAPSPATTVAAAGAPGVEAGDAGVRVVRATHSPEAASAVPADGRAGELVESYADAAAQLAATASALREERDALRQQLAELRQTLAAGQHVAEGRPLDAALSPVLAAMAQVGGVEHAAFWLASADGPPRAASLLRLREDPLLASTAIARSVVEAARRAATPTFVTAEDGPEIAAALAKECRFVAALAVPLRATGSQQRTVLLYYRVDSARPGASALTRLAEIPEALSAALDLHAALETVKAGERALQLALTGRASVAGVERVVGALEELRDRLGEIRGRRDAPPWFTEQYVRLAPALGSALEDARSLLGFSRGELRRERIDVDELLTELRAADVVLELAPALDAVPVDAPLLRIALRAVLDELRSAARGTTTRVGIETSASAEALQITVRSETGSVPAGTAGASLGIGVARRILEMHGGSLEQRLGETSAEILMRLPTR